ncbi:hypothetical protein MCC01995_08350 [Bifidobacteriaceae bacterium MCC01995]|nr:hypothetical protein MCC01995_08350 [Bifidobacteriaceae bacterium MCC01995]
MVSLITAFSNRRASSLRLNSTGSSHPSSTAGTRASSSSGMSPPIPFLSYAAAHLHTLAGEQPTSLTTAA